MNKIRLFLTPLCLLAYSAAAQLTILGADAYGRANSLVAVPCYSSIYQNPAGIGGEASGFLAFNFLKTVPVEGFHTTGVQGVFRTEHFNYGFSVDSFGDNHYRESRAGLALARKQERVSVGMKVSGIGMHAAGMGSLKTLVGEVGMVVTPAPQVSLGLSLSHFTLAGFQPVRLSLGAAVRPEAKVHLSGQLDYPVGGRAEVRLGLHYQLRKQLGFSAGIDPALRRVHFGTNVLAGRYGFLYGVATHPYVGIAHHTTFIYQLHD